jgi:ClpP class serine protease
MKYAHILTEISRQHWAITDSAMRGILSALDGSLDLEDRPKFHAAEIEAISSQLGERISDRRFSSVLDSVGILQINGPLIPRGDAFTDVSGLASIDRLTSEFKAFELDESIEQILLVIDSPGGSVVGVSEFASLIKSSSKPTTAYIYGFAASAAYWIASAADKIVAGDTGLVGSIGVVLSVYRQKEDDPIEIISAVSPRKRPDPESEDGRAQLQIAKNRDVSEKTVRSKFGQGGMVFAPNAVSVGMIDQVVTLDKYLRSLTSDLFAEEEKTTNNIVDKQPLSSETTEDKSGMLDASELPREETQMKDLDKFLAENPAANSDYESRLKAAREAGAKAVEDEQKKTLEAASKILNSNYPENIKAVALQVIEGKKSIDSLETVITVFDAMKADSKISVSTEDSDDVPATPAQQEQGSEDGVVRTEADFDKAVESLKSY